MSESGDQHEPTRACLLTAAGPGAIAVVVVWGPRARECVESRFRPYGSGGRGISARRPLVGRFGPAPGDEVVAVAREAPSCVEIQCHGGAAANQLVLGSLRDAGVRIVSKRHWLRNLVRGGIEQRAEFLLARAKTLRTAQHLHAQAHGALRAELDAVIAEISNGRAREAKTRLDRLRGRSHVGMRLAAGFRVVVSGRPNVGKSMLINALVGYERAIVDPTPGTTRDLLTVDAACAGWPVELADTAGVRETGDPLERAGITQARRYQQSADLTLLILDRSEPIGESDQLLLDRTPDALRVANKADLDPAWASTSLGAIDVSALRGAGIDRLVDAIAMRLVPHPPAVGDAIPFRRAQERRIEQVQAALRVGELDRAIRILAGLLR